MQGLSETSERDIAMYLRGQLIESQRWTRTVTTACYTLLAINWFMTVLLVLIYLGWI